MSTQACILFFFLVLGTSIASHVFPIYNGFQLNITNEPRFQSIYYAQDLNGKYDMDIEVQTSGAWTLHITDKKSPPWECNSINATACECHTSNTKVFNMLNRDMYVFDKVILMNHTRMQLWNVSEHLSSGILLSVQEPIVPTYLVTKQHNYPLVYTDGRYVDWSAWNKRVQSCTVE